MNVQADSRGARGGHTIARLVHRWGFADERDFLLRVFSRASSG